MIALSLRDPDHVVMKTLGWQRDYPAEYRLHPAIADFDPATSIYRDISHLFVFTGFALPITSIAARRI